MTVIDTYVIQITREAGATERWDPDQVSSALSEAEENISDLLPDGYAARVSHWAQEDKPHA